MDTPVSECRKLNSTPVIPPFLSRSNILHQGVHTNFWRMLYCSTNILEAGNLELTLDPELHGCGEAAAKSNLGDGKQPGG
jgi:hypothetical protein